jgi:hypothetical protein
MTREGSEHKRAPRFINKVSYKMTTKYIHLAVSSAFVPPAVYTSGSPNEIEEALYIGATIQSTVKTRHATNEVKHITEQKDAEISAIQTSYTDKLNKLSADLRTVTEEKETLTAQYNDTIREAKEKEHILVAKEWEQKQNSLRKELEIITMRYEALEAHKRILEDNRSKDINEAVQRTEQFMDKLVSSKQEQLTKLEQAYNKLNDVIGKQSDEITKLSSLLGKRSANVKVKGNDYEEEFNQKLKRHYSVCNGFALKDTRLGSGHEMDLSMEMEGHVILWELKNYTSTVPKGEVDKFLRDLKENPQATVGVMVSRLTDISGKSQSGLLQTEFDGNKMMIYINKFEEFCGEEEAKVFGMLSSLFRIWWQYHRSEEGGFDREEIVRELETAIQTISKRRTDWRRHKSHMEEAIRYTSELLEDAENSLDRILKKAKNHHVEVTVGAPTSVFRETTDEKETIWINSIMNVCKEAEKDTDKGEIEVRELVELLSKHHKISKDSIRSNVMSVLQDTAIGKRGTIKIVKGLVRRCEVVPFTTTTVHNPSKIECGW